ncbi:MAG: hsdS [Frankiales bacterium]|nr:hsdS [Frankiales bacterium]
MTGIRLKYVAEVLAGQSPSSADVQPLSEGLPFVQGNAEFGGRTPVPQLECANPPRIAVDGDVLVSVRAPVGAVNVATGNLGIGRGLCAVRPRTVDPDYLYWFLASSSLELERVSTGTTFSAVSARDVENLRLPAFSIERQRNLSQGAAALTGRIDRLLARQAMLMQRLAERKLALIDAAVWHGIRQSPMAATNLEPAPMAPAHWGRGRNRRLLAERTELSRTGEEEMLSVSHLTGVTPRAEKTVTMFEAESTVGYRLVSPGDLVINTMWAWMGALGVSRDSGIVSPAYGVYSFQADVDTRYFEYLYRSRPYVTEMTRHSRGIWSSRLRLYPAVFLRLNVVVPPREEQSEIADFLEDRLAGIDTLLAKTERFIALAKERRAALVAMAVNGELDRTGAA